MIDSVLLQRASASAFSPTLYSMHRLPVTENTRKPISTLQKSPCRLAIFVSLLLLPVVSIWWGVLCTVNWYVKGYQILIRSTCSWKKYLFICDELHIDFDLWGLQIKHKVIVFLHKNGILPIQQLKKKVSWVSNFRIITVWSSMANHGY